jgi:hypothetical protein
VPESRAEPDTRPLGYIAIGAAGLTVLLALSYLLTPLALLTGVLAMLFGAAARTVPESRQMGNAALVVAPIAMVLAVVIILSYD